MRLWLTTLLRMVSQFLFGAMIAHGVKKARVMNRTAITQRMECTMYNWTISVPTEKGEPMNNLLWSVALKNSIAIICWTLLAVHFDKWWIALFGALFLTSASWREKDESN